MSNFIFSSNKGKDTSIRSTYSGTHSGLKTNPNMKSGGGDDNQILTKEYTESENFFGNITKERNNNFGNATILWAGSLLSAGGAGMIGFGATLALAGSSQSSVSMMITGLTIGTAWIGLGIGVVTVGVIILTKKPIFFNTSSGNFIKKIKINPRIK